MFERTVKIAYGSPRCAFTWLALFPL